MSLTALAPLTAGLAFLREALRPRGPDLVAEVAVDALTELERANNALQSSLTTFTGALGPELAPDTGWSIRRLLILANLGLAIGLGYVRDIHFGGSSAYDRLDTKDFRGWLRTCLASEETLNSAQSSGLKKKELLGMLRQYQARVLVVLAMLDVFKRELAAGHRVLPDDADRDLAVGDALDLQAVQAAELRDLIESQAGILDQPDSGGLRHQRTSHSKSLVFSSLAGVGAPGPKRAGLVG